MIDWAITDAEIESAKFFYARTQAKAQRLGIRDRFPEGEQWTGHLFEDRLVKWFAEFGMSAFRETSERLFYLPWDIKVNKVGISVKCRASNFPPEPYWNAPMSVYKADVTERAGEVSELLFGIFNKGTKTLTFAGGIGKLRWIQDRRFVPEGTSLGGILAHEDDWAVSLSQLEFPNTWLARVFNESESEVRNLSRALQANGERTTEVQVRDMFSEMGPDQARAWIRARLAK